MTQAAPTDRLLTGIGVADVAATLAVVALGQQEVWAPISGHVWSHIVGPRVVLSFVYLTAAVALLWRRRAPLTVVAVVSVVLCGDFVLFGAPDGLAPVLIGLIGLYAAGRYGDRARFVAALAVTAAEIAVHEWQDPQYVFGGQALTVWAVVLAGGLVGWTLNSGARDREELSARARRLEADREGRALAAVAAERARIAGELHDLVGHGISLMVLQLVATQANLEQGQVQSAQERLARLETTARTTLAEMRRLVNVMDNQEVSLAPQPGLGEIGALVDEIRHSGVPVEFEITGMVDTPPGVGLAVYRVVQEALTNVIKHTPPGAGAKVVIDVASEALTVEVADSGPGLAGDLGGGRGLAGMRERVALYGGTLQFGTPPEGGFRVRACFPLERVRV